MKKDYCYISEKPAKGNHAGNKAREDIDEILAEVVGVKVAFYECRNFKGVMDKVSYILNPMNIGNIYKINALKGLRIIIQYPFYCDFITKKALMNCLKNNEVCLVVHDVDSLRNFGSYTTTQEVEIFNKCHRLIIHNIKMAEALTSLGVKTEMITLQLFDYLRESVIAKNHELGNTIAFAGNLEKSEFLCKNIDSLGIKFNLYGPNFDMNKISSKYIKYNGSFSPDDVPKKIDGSFGLIWDGNSLDTCSGEYGEYMKYNNPHKLSLYISARLPVIVWSKSAVADFVKKENIGFVIDKMIDIKSKILSLDKKEYDVYLNNIKKIQENIVSGYYSKAAIKKAIS